MPIPSLFSSKLAAVLTMIGVAVGLGNVWRFPYMMGKYGGSAFLLVYILFTLLFALPALVGEITLGRSTRKGPIGAFRIALGKSKGGAIGHVLLITILVASSYYAVVIANVSFTAYHSICYGFSESSLVSYSAGLSNGLLQFSITVVVIILSLIVIKRGLKNGIELVSKVFVPFFLVTILFLIYYTLTLDGAMRHLFNFLKPNFSELTPINIFAALGQAFYSLSLGGTFMVVYGSYLQPEESIKGIAGWTAIGDVGAALLASLFIVPAVLVYNLDMTAGPTLIFSTLPKLFEAMPLGQYIGSSFLVALGLVAFLSLVAALDVAKSCFLELEWTSSNINVILVVIAAIEVVLAYPSAFDSNLIGTLDLVFGSGMQLVGSCVSVIAVGWFINKKTIDTQLSDFGPSLMNWLTIWFKWTIPLILIVVLIGYIYSSINA